MCVFVLEHTTGFIWEYFRPYLIFGKSGSPIPNMWFHSINYLKCQDHSLWQCVHHTTPHHTLMCWQELKHVKIVQTYLSHILMTQSSGNTDEQIIEVENSVGHRAAFPVGCYSKRKLINGWYWRYAVVLRPAECNHLTSDIHIYGQSRV